VTCPKSLSLRSTKIDKSRSRSRCWKCLDWFGFDWSDWCLVAVTGRFFVMYLDHVCLYIAAYSCIVV
jgi:hypothetical protein